MGASDIYQGSLFMPDWKLHNAMWPGLVGKEPGSAEPPISLERMLDMTQQARAGERRFDGVDLFLYEPHLDIHADEADIRRLADSIGERGLAIGSVVAPVWDATGGGSAMGGDDERDKFLAAVTDACRYAQVLREHGVRQYGIVRIDSADSPAHWQADPVGNTRRIAATFREAGKIAQDHGERLAAEGEICWAGMHSWRDMLDLLELVDMPAAVGFQADLAHTYLYLFGYNAPQQALLGQSHTEQEFWDAYQTLTNHLRPWTLDFHIAQSDGSVHGTGSHDKTGRHCPADDPNGKLDIARCTRHWLLEPDGTPRQEIRHICWDGCMFPNSTLESQATWNTILRTMVETVASLDTTNS